MNISKEMFQKPSYLKPLVLMSAMFLGSFTQTTQAALSFTFNYTPSVDGHGFDDPTYGAARQSALSNAASLLGNYFVNYTANLTYDVVSYSANDGTLASAGSGQYLVPGSFQPTVVQEKILSNGGVDENATAADGEINWNFNWNWGLTNAPSSSQYDFTSTAIHELLHSFGFGSNVGAGGLGFALNALGTADTWTTFDSFLTDSSGNKLINSSGIFDATKVGALTAGTTNAAGVLFNGANAIAANGGQGIPIYSPNPFSAGSSIAHLDDKSSVTNTSIMNAAAHNLGLDVRTLGPIELGILKDIGYVNVTAVPLPSAVWLMLSGIMAVLGFQRKRKTL